jgi:hypothetical protein
MSLPAASPHHHRKHRRQFDAQAFARGHGQWSADATLVYTRKADLPPAERTGPVGMPLRVMGDRCHALRSDGAAIDLQDPRWYRAVPSKPPSMNED